MKHSKVGVGLIVSVMSLAVAGCGNQKEFKPITYGQFEDPISLTGAATQSGHNFTSFNSQETIRSIKSSDFSKKAVASPIKNFELGYFGEANGKVDLHFSSLQTPVEISNPTLSEPVKISQEGKDFELSCLDTNCEVKALKVEEKGDASLYILNSEEREIEIEVEKQAAEKAKATVKVIEKVGGQSKFEMVSKTASSEFAIEGDLVEPSGECTELKVKSGLTSACLIGNTSEGEIIIKAEKDSKKIHIKTLERKPTLAVIAVQNSTNSRSAIELPEFCKVGSKSEQDVLIQEIVSDCQRTELIKAVKTYWLAGGAKIDLQNFLELTLKSKESSEKKKQFMTMTKVLIANHMHPIASTMTLVESRFNVNAINPVGAAGAWQFMPETAKSYGLSLSPVDQRLDIAASTWAGAKMLKQTMNMAKFDGSFKLAIAAYNCGAGCVNKALSKIGHGYAKDYWTLHKFRMVPEESRNHVIRLFSAALIWLDPSYFGIDTVPALLTKPITVL